MNNNIYDNFPRPTDLKMEKEDASKHGDNICFYRKNANISYMQGFSIIRVKIKAKLKKYLKTYAPKGMHRCHMLENVSYPEWSRYRFE